MYLYHYSFIIYSDDGLGVVSCGNGTVTRDKPLDASSYSEFVNFIFNEIKKDNIEAMKDKPIFLTSISKLN